MEGKTLKEPYASCLTNPEFVRFVEDEVMKSDYAEEPFNVGDVCYAQFADDMDVRLVYKPVVVEWIGYTSYPGFDLHVYKVQDECEDCYRVQ